jgi:hypothetical protein
VEMVMARIVLLFDASNGFTDTVFLVCICVLG